MKNLMEFLYGVSQQESEIDDVLDNDGAKPKGSVKDSAAAIVANMLEGNICEAQVVQPSRLGFQEIDNEFGVSLTPYWQQHGGTVVRLRNSVALVKNGRALEHRGYHNSRPPHEDIVELQEFIASTAHGENEMFFAEDHAGASKSRHRLNSRF